MRVCQRMKGFSMCGLPADLRYRRPGSTWRYCCDACYNEMKPKWRGEKIKMERLPPVVEVFL